MPEQTFRSPGFFEREIDLTQQQQGPVGVPAGIIGTAERGPAFVPVTVGSYADFERKFGSLDSKRFGPYAVREFLKNRTSATYLRVLGAGANDTTGQIEKTRLTDQVRHAGFVVTGSDSDLDSRRSMGAVQFIVASHYVSASELVGMPMFTDNDSFADSDGGIGYNMVRAVVFTASGSRLMVLNGESESYSDTVDDAATVASDGTFKLVLSSSDGSLAQTDGFAGVKIFTASLNPTNTNYVGKLLNTDPEKFAEEQHLLYLDLAVDNELASPDTTAASVAVVSGTLETSNASGDTSLSWFEAFGHFDTRYRAPQSPKIISQPFGNTEYDLFRFESLDDGAYANDKVKISIVNIRGSLEATSEWGSFAVQVRLFTDDDTAPEVLEQFNDCNLNPNSENYVARVIGDRKVWYNFDADQEDERRLVLAGRFGNRSNYIRVVMEDAVENKTIPEKSLPFGFRGPEVLKTSDTLLDSGSFDHRINGLFDSEPNGALSSSILPPVPYRFKVTRGTAKSTSVTFAGDPGTSEIVDSRYYWGTKFNRNNNALNPNISKEQNRLLPALTKLHGLRKLDTLVTGSGADTFNNNKFTLARVALFNGEVSDVTGSAEAHMRQAAYIRNGVPDSTEYKVDDGVRTVNRVTFASLLAQTSSADFNRFSRFMKFTTFLQGGFDGLNILDANTARMNDRSTSSDTDGGAESGFRPSGLKDGNVNPQGVGSENAAVASYNAAINIMTDTFNVNTNILAIPGIRDSFVTDNAVAKVRDYGLAIYLMDIVKYDDGLTRLFDDSNVRPDVRKTSEQFDSRAVDNNYGSAYFPDVTIEDEVNNQLVDVPASIAAIAALGFNDKVAFPWFAPAGFNRGALDFVDNVEVRLNNGDRDILQDARINPIAVFPGGSHVIFGQKTLQQARSALDRVNVRRMLLEVKRIIIDVARKIVFEQNDVETRTRFIEQSTPLLANVQIQQGIERFEIVMDESNNLQSDIEANKLNGRITVVPTRTAEFVAVDFIVTNAGVSFE